VLEIARLLPEIFDEISGSTGSTESNREVDLINGLLAWIRQQGVEVAPLLTPARALRAVHPAGVTPIYPPTGLSAPWLFTAGRADPSLFAELRAELNSADRIDVLVSFITWSGLRKLIDVLESVTAVDASGTPRTRLRVITTTYTGASEGDMKETNLLVRWTGQTIWHFVQSYNHGVAACGARVPLNARRQDFALIADPNPTFLSTISMMR
jgi:hypothetical protein